MPESKTLPFFNDQPLIFLGPIPNMPDCCVLAGSKSGRIYSGFHTERFIELPDDEL